MNMNRAVFVAVKREFVSILLENLRHKRDFAKVVRRFQSQDLM